MAGAAINSKIPSEADRWFCAHVHLMLTGQNCEARQGRAGQNRVGMGWAGQDMGNADLNSMHAKLHTKAPCLPKLS